MYKKYSIVATNGNYQLLSGKIYEISREFGKNIDVADFGNVGRLLPKSATVEGIASFGNTLESWSSLHDFNPRFSHGR